MTWFSGEVRLRVPKKIKKTGMNFIYFWNWLAKFDIDDQRHQHRDRYFL
jgi:hypothetical protein